MSDEEAVINSDAEADVSDSHETTPRLSATSPLDVHDSRPEITDGSESERAGIIILDAAVHVTEAGVCIVSMRADSL